MSTFSSQKLAAHEVEDYCAHLLRLDCIAQTRRFGGHLSQSALAERAQLAQERAACVLIARIDGHIRAAVELWKFPGVDTRWELALSVEADVLRQSSSLCDLEVALMEGALRAARDRGVSRLIYLAGPSEKLPRLPDGFGTSPWRPWSDLGTWFCDLAGELNDRSSPETIMPPAANNVRSHTQPCRVSTAQCQRPA